MLPREQYIFRGCLLLLAIIVSLIVFFFSLILGEPADFLNRLGILFEIVGIVAVLPEIIGEEKLEKAIFNAKSFHNAQEHIKKYLYSSQEESSQNTSVLVIALSLLGNLTMSLLIIWLWTGLIFSPLKGSWISLVLLLFFSFLSFEAVTWIFLFLLFWVFRPIVKKAPKLFDFFIVTNSFISALGTLISVALAYLLIIALPLIIPIAKLPLRKTITLITLPFVLIGAILQLIATYY